MNSGHEINYDYVVGEEKTLKEIVKGPDILPLLECAVKAGASSATVENERGETIYRCGSDDGEAGFNIKKPFYVEGETVGQMVIKGPAERGPLLSAVAGLIYESVKIIIRSNFKTLLATETHKTVVSKSYEELLETNRKLTISEARYRELASGLEKQVQERTHELKQAHAKLLHQEKIASVGQLAAGIAHEINNPLGFILSNINTLRNYISKFKELLFLYHNLMEKNMPHDEHRERALQLWNDSKLDFIFPDVDDLIRESVEGAERVKKIVADLKGFSHIDEADTADIDINGEIDRTLSVLTHEIPPAAEIIRVYGELPRFTCNPAHMCQVFFNIILNALQACGENARLTITTAGADKTISIIFEDNGPGMPEHVMKRIFDPFFTTKEVGKGTGMGLNVVYEIITSYGGSIDVESTVGACTMFRILLPLSGKTGDMRNV